MLYQKKALHGRAGLLLRVVRAKLLAATAAESMEPYFSSDELLPSRRRAMINSWIC